MKMLSRPHEIFELRDGQTITTQIVGWELGEMVIHPGRTEVEKVIEGMRIYVPETDKEFFPYYWDITSGTLIAQLSAWLMKDDYKRFVYTITKHGLAPRARFSLKVSPKTGG